jgi:DNA invertase Pin-like site-specific DNA recombinase/transcriptional regulator NrdR family protein
MKTAISYLRYSSKKQSTNDSYRRQIEATEKFCKEHDLILSERLEDLGISAWKGKNLTDESALGGLLKLIEAGKIPKGTVLICENLDRLSRAKILDALHLFTSILKGGVEIVTSMDGKWYSEKSVSDNPMDLIVSITYLTRGNNESEVKSERVRKTWIHRHKEMQNGTFFKYHCPSWLNHDGRKYELIKENAKTVKLVFDLYLKGYGVYSLIKELNKRGVKSFTKSGQWKPVFIHQLLQNPAVIGTCDLVTPAVKNYYPAVVSEEIFYKAIAQRQQNSNFKGKAGSKEINIFGGICKCHKCGSNMVKYTCGKGDKKYNFLICSKAKIGKCKYTFTPFNKFNDSFLSVLNTNNFSKFLNVDKPTKDKSETIRGRIIEMEKTIERVASAIVETDSPSLVTRLKLLEIEKKQLEKDYENEKANNMSKTDSTVDYNEITVRLNEGLKDNEFRAGLRNFIRRNISSIVVKQSGYRVNFANHPEHITIDLNKDDFEAVVAGERTTFDYFAFKPEN